MSATSRGRWLAWERLRLFLWRTRVLFALLYLGVLGGMVAFLWLYPRKMPPGMDLGLTVAVRSWLHQRTFSALEEARGEVERGQLERAESRLEGFLGEHGDSQKGQMYTQALSDSHELLSEIYVRQGRWGRAVKTLEVATARTPLSWRLWARLGDRHAGRGDLDEAAAAYREAFKLSLDHPEVTESYLEVLGELGRHEDILWVHDHFLRAAQRAAPLVEVKAGRARPKMQQRALDFAGIPVEHGDYTRSLRRYGLERGEARVLELPGELFAGLGGSEIHLQLRFHNVYYELRIDGLVARPAKGDARVLSLAADQVASLHREGSGGDYHFELRVDLPQGALRSLEVTYSCPRHLLSESALAIVDGARRNLAVRGGS